MACNIKEQKWTSFPAKGGRILVEGERYFLQVEGGNGEREALPLDNMKPLAIDFRGESEFQWAFSDWREECEEEGIEKFQLKPQNIGSNFVFGRAGDGIGISDIRDSGIRVIYIDLMDSPLVLLRIADKIVLRFRKIESKYYYPAAFKASR